MPASNADVVKGYIEVLNNRQFDRVFEFCDEHCVLHTAPYVGVGVTTDDSNGTQLFVKSVARGSPATGVLRAGDELMRASDGRHIWEGFEQLKTGLWGQGVLGTPLTLTVMRDGEILDLTLMRGHIEAFDIPLAELVKIWPSSMVRTWPDLKTDIQLIFEHDDFVAFYAVDSGTNAEYMRGAIWGECSIFRLRDGKIIELWSVEDGFGQLKQLGYEVEAPQPEPAA